jgi:hypothetical protein
LGSHALGRAVGREILDDDERPSAGFALDLVRELGEQVRAARGDHDATAFGRHDLRRMPRGASSLAGTLPR